MQSLPKFAYRREFIIHQLVPANATQSQQIYATTAIKSGHAMVWKAIMTVEAEDLKTDPKQYIYFAWS